VVTGKPFRTSFIENMTSVVCPIVLQHLTPTIVDMDYATLNVPSPSVVCIPIHSTLLLQTNIMYALISDK